MLLGGCRGDVRILLIASIPALLLPVPGCWPGRLTGAPNGFGVSPGCCGCCGCCPCCGCCCPGCCSPGCPGCPGCGCPGCAALGSPGLPDTCGSGGSAFGSVCGVCSLGR